jgi:hypothetical protein
VRVEQVRRLDVAVPDLLLVHVVERLARLACVPDGLDRIEARAAALAQQGAGVPAGSRDPISGSRARVDEVVPHADHARMVEVGQQSSLDLESRLAGPRAGA